LKKDGVLYPVDVDADNRSWMPGEAQQVDLRMDCRRMAAGDYELCIGMFAGERPVKLALKESCYAEGYYALCKVTVSEI